MENKFYVYILYNSITNEPFYVGKGIGNRVNIHFINSKNPKTHLHRRIAKLTQENIRVEQIFCENEYEALGKEVYLISKFGRQDLNLGPLLNLTNGGEGIYGYKHTKEAREKISEANRNSSIETRQKISNALKGRKRIFSEQHKHNIAKSRIGQKNSEESKKSLSAKMKGRKFTDQQRKNMSEARKGIKFSEEHKQNISKARKRLNTLAIEETV
jgi:hypothetical protein